jgi:hypothetical protein
MDRKDMGKSLIFNGDESKEVDDSFNGVTIFFPSYNMFIKVLLGTRILWGKKAKIVVCFEHMVFITHAYN